MTDGGLIGTFPPECPGLCAAGDAGITYSQAEMSNATTFLGCVAQNCAQAPDGGLGSCAQ
jgi:hypothetical protein